MESLRVTGTYCRQKRVVIFEKIKAATTSSKMVDRGQPVSAGVILLSGSLVPISSEEKGDVIHAQLGKLGFINSKFV